MSIKIPETLTDLSKEEIPLWIEKFGGFGVIKVTYGNFRFILLPIAKNLKLFESS